MLTLLTGGLLGPGIIILKVLFWVGTKIISLFSSTSAKYSADASMFGRLGALAARPKTPEVASEMAHITQHLQGSPFSPFRIAAILGVLVTIWGIIGWFFVGPHYKHERDQARTEMGKACVSNDKREICKQVFAFADHEEEMRQAILAAQAQTLRERADYRDQLQKLAGTIKDEKGRAARAAARIKKANDDAKTANGTGRSIDEYRSSVRQLFEPAFATETGSAAASSGAAGEGAGVRSGPGAVSASGNEPGAEAVGVKPADGL